MLLQVYNYIKNCYNICKSFKLLRKSILFSLYCISFCDCLTQKVNVRNKISNIRKRTAHSKVLVYIYNINEVL